MRVIDRQVPTPSEPTGNGALVEGHLPRIAALARRFSGPGIEVSDLVQEGWLALLEARRRFEPARGVPFWAYAVPWVHGAIYRLAQDQRRAVRLPPAAQVELGRIRRAGQQLGGSGGEPKVAELARRTGLPADRVALIVAAGRPARSFQEALGADRDGRTLIDMLPDPCGEDAYADVLSRAGAPDVGNLMDALSPREREIISRRFGIGRPPQTLADIGRLMGVTRERIRQIESRALGKLRAAAQAPTAA